MTWWRRAHQRWRRWLFRQRGYDVLTIKIHVSKDLLEDRNPVTADLVGQQAEERARSKTLERMGLVPS
jgi:hypothetical protein